MNQPNYIGAVPCGACGGGYRNDGVPYPGNGRLKGDENSGNICSACDGTGWIVVGPPPSKRR